MQTDPEVRRYVGGQGAAWPRAKAIERFKERYLGKPADTYGMWATILKEDGTYIGCCGLARDVAGVHLGYYIARSYWGNGFASEAAQAFVDRAFGCLRLERILADVEKNHVVSEHILQKLGFSKIGEEEAPRDRIICRYELIRPAGKTGERQFGAEARHRGC